MKTVEAVRAVMKEQDIGVNKMAARLDKPSRQISERLSQSNISISKLNELLRVLDYRVVIIPRDVSIPKGGYEIE